MDNFSSQLSFDSPYRWEIPGWKVCLFPANATLQPRWWQSKYGLKLRREASYSRKADW